MNLLYDHKVTVLRSVLTADAFGSSTELEGVTHYQLPCKITEVTSGTTGRVFGRKGLPCSYNMWCGVCDILENDRIMDGTTKYEVLDVVNWKNRFLKIRLGWVK
jgi:hypothetical protein